MFAGFEERIFSVSGAEIHCRVGGKGAPVLLLHGFPQTSAMWHRVAEELAGTYTVVAPDLRGYGRSLAHDHDFTFRAMGNDMAEVMTQLGHERFDAVGHDRGARVTHRMALDHTSRLRSVTLLDILPTLDVWDSMDGWLARRYYHWSFLGQATDLPRVLVGARPMEFFTASMQGLSAGEIDFVAPLAMQEYAQAAVLPTVIDAWCGDYLAAATTDLDHDQADLGRVLPQPCLVMWGSRGVVGKRLDPVSRWRRWFPHASGQEVTAGHFLVEEAPQVVLPVLHDHFQRVAGGY